MKKLFLASLLALLLLGALPNAALASPGVPLCLPGASGLSLECMQLGPSAYLSRMSQFGLSFPMRPLPVEPIDPALSDLEFNYATVTTMDGGELVPRPFFATVQDAVEYVAPSGYMKGGSTAHYVTYTSVQTVDGTNYYLTENGWMRRSDLSPAQVRRFTMGLEFTSTPSRPFGWVLEYANGENAPYHAWSAPSMSASRSSATFDAYSTLQVFDIQLDGDLKWYMVGPDQWLSSLQMRLVYPMSGPPEGVEGGRWIEINLEEQTFAIYEDNQLVFATMIATGLDNLWTRPGLFEIYEAHQSTTMSGDFSGGTGGYYWLSDVPWTLYYDEARAIHGAYWRPRQFFGFQGSHGCVNLSVGDAHWVFEWAQLGDWVYVHDPSGRTPTDAEFAYGAGAP